MSFTYTITKINTLGDHDDTYGQRYWGQVQEEDKDISFNLKDVLDIAPGTVITAEESMNKQTLKGKSYLQLKKVKVTNEQVSVPAVTRVFPGATPVATAPTEEPRLYKNILETLERIEYKLDKYMSTENPEDY